MEVGLLVRERGRAVGGAESRVRDESDISSTTTGESMEAEVRG